MGASGGFAARQPPGFKILRHSRATILRAYDATGRGHILFKSKVRHSLHPNLNRAPRAGTAGPGGPGHQPRGKLLS
jgi:hypothetical protein